MTRWTARGRDLDGAQDDSTNRQRHRGEEIVMKSMFVALVVTLLAGACATDARIRDADRAALYEAHAGAPVNSFRYMGSLNGWTPLGDGALALWTRPKQAYLLTFNGDCPDLDFAQAISVSSQFQTVSKNFDTVTALGSGSVVIPCRIREIRPLDVAAIKDAERQMRADAQVSERK